METIEKEIWIEAPIETVWGYLEDPDRLAAWVYFLTVLRAHLEYDVDIVDKTIETGGSFSTLFDPRSVGFEPEDTPPSVGG
jgi:hypothetical protein